MMDEELRVLDFYDEDATSAAMSMDENIAASAWLWLWRRRLVALNQELRDF